MNSKVLSGIPHSHLSGNKSRGYSLLSKGCALSKDGLSKDECLAIAKSYNLKIDRVWDGEMGEFINL